MGDTSKHITYFKVENFKRFESLEIKNIGQFNLIVGDNNVGKTSLLEALLVNEDPLKLINGLINALEFRALKNNFVYSDFELFFNKEKGADQPDPVMRFELGGSVLKKLNIILNRSSTHLIFDGDFLETVTKRFFLPDRAFFNPFYANQFVPFYEGYGSDLAAFYSKLQSSRKLKDKFLNSLKTLIPNINNIELSSPYQSSSQSQNEPSHLIVYQNHVDSSIPLALMGDGSIRLFRLLASIVLNKGNRLMIDEVDTGIHYTHFSDFWKVIIKTAIENNVQLFMTTHNEECIKYFVEDFQNEDLRAYQSRARSISLIEDVNHAIKAFTYPFDSLEANLSMGNEVRGGAR